MIKAMDKARSTADDEENIFDLFLLVFGLRYETNRFNEDRSRQRQRCKGMYSKYGDPGDATAVFVHNEHR